VALYCALTTSDFASAAERQVFPGARRLCSPFTPHSQPSLPIQPWGNALGRQPAQVSVANNRRHGANAFQILPDECSHQSLGGEQGHLGVVGDRADAAVSWGVIDNPIVTEALLDLRPSA